MKTLNRLGILVICASLCAVGLVSSASAISDPTFPCVVVNIDTCTVTIPLTSNMNEQVGSTMPDTKPWSMTQLEGKGPYGLTGPGNEQTTWDGVGGATQGSVWTAILTTDANEPAGSEAVLTFSHVTSSTTTTGPAEPYSYISDSYPFGAARGSVATISATVRPVPAKGHLVLMRKNGASWSRIAVATYSPKTKKWVMKFKWVFPAHGVETFRVLATAAPGLSDTYGPTFKMSTLK